MAYQPPAHTESSILQTFLLPPTPHPTILPYPAFLKVVPAKYVNDPTYSRVLKRLYRDLQLQRDLDVETVRANIERECARAPTLQAALARQIAREEGHSARKDRAAAVPKKRKRPAHDLDDESEDASELSDSAIAMNANESVDEDDQEDLQIMDTDDDLHHESAVQFAFAKHPLNAHPAANFESGPTSARSASRKLYTKTALLDAMQNANGSLIEQNEDLERVCKEKLAELAETVGGLSDLRYGTFSGKGGGGDKVGELLGAMGVLRELLSGRITGEGNAE